MLFGLVATYIVAATLTRDLWIGRSPQAGTQVTYAATTPEGAPPTAESLAQTRDVLGKRVSGLGRHGSEVRVDDDTLTVTVPGDGALLAGITVRGGRLYLRPILHSIPAGTATTTAAPPSAIADPAEAIADEKRLRQSTDQTTEILAMQFQAGRCGQDDVLAGNDDPGLPLVTCSEDGTLVHLLDKSIISGEQIAGTTSFRDEQSGGYVAAVSLDPEGAQALARFTKTSTGTPLAFTLDSRVVAAPVTREEITGGQLEIHDGFTLDQARDLAARLGGGALPLTLTEQSSHHTTIAAPPASTPLRVALAATGIILVIAVLGAAIWIFSRRRQAP